MHQFSDTYKNLPNRKGIDGTMSMWASLGARLLRRDVRDGTARLLGGKPGKTFKAANGRTYIVERNGSLRRHPPKIKGKSAVKADRKARRAAAHFDPPF